ncbi:uncharacterized protein LOC131162846 [Malania oleifera]|uniref:uncharacterized protein LOC131162846 n=1 Tax=Malania oleifera TaxID=397392 RepID=UPI0025AE9BE6|nr:uncharacterized protein LOC131162846 [Malania oleifera]
MWTLHGDFLKMVESSWREHIVVDSGFSKLAGKLKKLKQKLRVWNKQTFSRVGGIIQELEERVEKYENVLQTEYSESIEEEFFFSKAELEVWYRREEIRLAQQAKKKWLTDGDQNSKFFHAMIAQRRRNSCVNSMELPDGSVLGNIQIVHDEAVNYFEQFLGQNSLVQMPNLDSIIQSVVFEDSIRQLKEEPTEEEVYVAISSIFMDSSPGPDGFGSSFYLTCWKIIKNDVMEAVRAFLQR